MQTNLYAKGDDVESINVWGKRDNYKPTNVAFLDDGGFFVADGYGLPPAITRSLVHHKVDFVELLSFGYE